MENSNKCIVMNYKGEDITIHENVNVDLENLQDEVANLYLVFEMGCGNTALISLVAAFCETEAVELCDILDEDLENIAAIKKLDRGYGTEKDKNIKVNQ